MPISSPLASGIPVTNRFEIVSGLVEMLAVADGVEPISSPLASGIPVANGFEIGSGLFVAWFVVSDAERLPLKDPVVVCTVPRLTVSRLPMSWTLAVMLM